MTQDAMLARLRALLPPWFPDEDPILDGLLSGVAALLVGVLALLDFAKAQTRIATTTGAFLDLAAYDFFRTRFRRRANEPDAAFSLRIRSEVLRPRSTRAAIAQALEDLTGVAPELREPWNPGDNGGWGRRMAWGGAAIPAVRVTGWSSPRSRWGRGTFAFATPRAAQGGAPGVGHYGAMAMRNQLLVRARRGSGGVLTVGPAGGYNTGRLAWGGKNPSPPEFLGWRTRRAGWSTPRLGWLRYAPPYAVSPGRGFYTDSAAQGRASDAEIYATVAATKAAGVTAWVHIDP